MKIVFRDETLPHQLHIEVDSAGVLFALCNCGEEFMKAKRLDGGACVVLYKLHMDQLQRAEDARQRTIDDMRH